LVGGQPEVQVETGRTVRETLAALGIVPEVVALVVVNEEQRSKDYVIQEGDIIRVLAVIGGG
jgi:sulfur carrier protein ThiS